MHLPHDLVGQPAKLARKESAEAVSIFNQSGVIKEYGVTESGNGIQCFLPVAHGDALNLSFDILSGEEQIVDILVDGIVREIIFNSRVAKIHRGKVVKVCACERRPSGVKGKLEHCDMVVQNRSTLRDLPPTAPDFVDTKPSAVGTIEVQILREIPQETGASRNARMKQVVRGPTFDDTYAWWSVSRRVDSGIIAPKYEIAFPNGQKTIGNPRKRISQGVEGYYLWASFKFLYRSASDLQAAGFDIFEHRPNQTLNSKINRSSKLSSKMDPTKPVPANIADKKLSSLSSNQSESVNQIVRLRRDTGNIGRSTPPDTIKDEVRGLSVAGYSPGMGLNDLPDQNKGQSDKDMTEVKADTKRNQPKKRTPLPEWFSAGHAVTEEPVVNHDVEFPIENLQDADTKSNSPYHNGIQGDAEAYETSGHRRGNSYLSESSSNNLEENHSLSLQSLADAALTRTNDHDGQSKAYDLLHSNSTGEDEATFNESYSRDPLDTNLWPATYSTSHVEGPKASVQEPPSRQKTGGESQQIVSDMHHETPVSLLRAKAGYYMTQSPLVATDADEMGSDANVEETSANTAGQVPIGQLIVQPQKRKFDVFDVYASIAPSPKSGHVYSINGNEWGKPPRARREEHTRKKQAKQEALMKARDEAEALRKQVYEIEAGQAEAIAREEAELEEYDIEIARIEQEKDALVARLQELNDM